MCNVLNLGMQTAYNIARPSRYPTPFETNKQMR